jgi:hypothetical protein
MRFRLMYMVIMSINIVIGWILLVVLLFWSKINFQFLITCDDVPIFWIFKVDFLLHFNVCFSLFF